MILEFEFDPDKDVVLRDERGNGFEEIIACILEDLPLLKVYVLHIFHH